MSPRNSAPGSLPDDLFLPGLQDDPALVLSPWSMLRKEARELLGVDAHVGTLLAPLRLYMDPVAREEVLDGLPALANDAWIAVVQRYPQVEDAASSR
jgi:hypothetical protein